MHVSTIPRPVIRLSALKRRARARGATLVEVLIVVAIMAMIAGGVAVFALPQYVEAQRKSAKQGAQVIRGAIQTWQATNNETSCPTMNQLVQEKFLDNGTSTVDPWNQPYTLTCVEDEVAVMSSGPDKKKGTPDDIRVPAAGGTTPDP